MVIVLVQPFGMYYGQHGVGKDLPGSIIWQDTIADMICIDIFVYIQTFTSQRPHCIHPRRPFTPSSFRPLSWLSEPYIRRIHTCFLLCQSHSP